MEKEFISPKGVYKPPTYSHAVKVGNTIYIAGQCGSDEQDNIVEGGFEVQALKLFENMGLVLEAAGASFKDVVKLNAYFSDCPENSENRQKYHEIRSQFFRPPLPAATNVIVVRPPFENLLLEVEALAVID